MDDPIRPPILVRVTEQPATVSRWCFPAGALVECGDLILVVEVDGQQQGLSAPVRGLLCHGCAPGDRLAPGGLVATILPRPDPALPLPPGWILQDVRLPHFSEEMTEGYVTNWQKAVGDRVSVGEVLVEVDTDKLCLELTAESDGILAEILVRDDGVKIGEVIATLMVSVDSS